MPSFHLPLERLVQYEFTLLLASAGSLRVGRGMGFFENEYLDRE